MTTSSGTRLPFAAHAVAALTVVLFIVTTSAVFVIASAAGQGQIGAFALRVLQAGTVPFVLGFGGVGWLLARRLPRHPIGWCFLLGALTWVLGALSNVYVELALAGHVDLTTLVRACMVLNVFSWIYAMPLSIQLPLLLLPNGQLLSRRWRPTVWLVGGGVIVGTIGFATVPGQIEGTDPDLRLVNPMGLESLGALPQVLALTGAGALLLAIVLGVLSVVLRFRRAQGVERQQLRWVALGGWAVLLSVVTALTSVVPQGVSGPISTLGIVAVPVCVGVAVLRYRLYDLGRVVSRTVSYAVLTALLLTVYFVVVTAAARLAPDGSSVAVAASTLAVAALFQPLRRRVQTIVDRRFNRARYDSDRTVDSFSRRLRDEVDLDDIRADLIDVVRNTLQPTTAGLWLRDVSR